MKNKKLLYTVLGALLIIGVVIGTLIFVNRGAPATDLTAFNQLPQVAEGIQFTSSSANSKAKVEGMKLVADNGKLALFINETSTEIALVKLDTNEVWFSSPPEREEDPIASPYEKNLLASTIIIQYRDQVGNLYVYNNYEKSIANEQFSLESIPDGVRVIYTLGDVSKGIDALPKYMSKQRFESIIIAKLPEGTANYVKARYMESKENPGVMERLDAQVEKQLVLNKMVKAFADAGYTEEDLAIDEAENGGGANTGEDKPTFKIALEYSLDDDQLVVNVPASTIEETSTYLIRTIDVLPFFGAAGVEDEGYMFVPDGSGSLIHLNNGKTKEEQYVQRVYGDDPNNTRWARGMVSESARMPVFGMKRNDVAWFAEITNSEAISSITSSISGMKNSYNNVFASFRLRGEDWLELYTGTMYQEIQILNEQRYNGNLEVRYTPLSKDQASYSGMAQVYRAHLVESGVLEQEQASDSIPFYLDVIGSYDTKDSFLGVPYRDIQSMTTYKEASTIVDELASNGVQNINMRYLGWFNKGIKHGTPSKIKLDSVVGSKKELQQLSQKLQNLGGNLFPDVAFQYMYNDDLALTPSSDAARFVTREVVELHPYNLALNSMRPMLGTYYLLSPSKLNYFVDEFMSKYSKYEMTGLSLRDLGNVVGADYRTTRVVHREPAKQIVQQVLDGINQNYETVVVGGHAYAWAYSDHIVDAPTSSSGFSLADESVPFYQMVLHGYIPYSGSSINLSDDQDVSKQLLHSLELGASPHFVWSYDDSSELKFTSYDEYYSTQYQVWFDDAVKMYNEVNEVLTKVSGAAMEERVVHNPELIEMKYDNGQSIIVNYSDKEAVVRGQVIAPQNYFIGGVR